MESLAAFGNSGILITWGAFSHPLASAQPSWSSQMTLGTAEVLPLTPHGANSQRLLTSLQETGTQVLMMAAARDFYAHIQNVDSDQLSLLGGISIPQDQDFGIEAS